MKRDRNDILREEGVDALREQTDNIMPLPFKKPPDVGSMVHPISSDGSRVLAGGPFTIAGFETDDDGTRYAKLVHPETGAIKYWLAEQLEVATPSNARSRDGIEYATGRFEPEPDVRWPKPITADALLRKPAPEREWFWKDLAPKGHVTLFSADGDSGKSTIGLQTGVACTAGIEELFGRKIEHGPALILNAEDDEGEIHRRLHAIAEHENILSPERVRDLHLLPLPLIPGFDPSFWVTSSENRSRIETTPGWKQLRQMVGDIRPVFVFLDPKANLFLGNDLERAHAVQVMATHLRGLAVEFKTSLMLADHPSQTGIASRTGAFASLGWSNSARSRLYLQRVKDKEGNEADPDVRELDTTKSNYARRGQKIKLRWRKGVFVLDNPFSTTAETSTRESRNQRAKELFLTLLKELLARGTNVSPNKTARNYAPKLMSDRARTVHGVTLGHEAFEQAMEELLTKKEIVTVSKGDRGTRLMPSKVS